MDIKLFDRTGLSILLNGGYLTLPNVNQSKIENTNLHSILIVGYNRDTRHFIGRNSWGGFWVKNISLINNSIPFHLSFRDIEVIFICHMNIYLIIALLILMMDYGLLAKLFHGKTNYQMLDN